MRTVVVGDSIPVVALDPRSPIQREPRHARPASLRFGDPVTSNPHYPTPQGPVSGSS